MTVLPPGHHFALTWSIPDSYGGMTTAMLQRSRAFARLTGVTVDILTFDTRDDYPAIERRLSARGDLIDGMRVLNLYEWLREHPLPGGSLRPERHVFTPLGGGLRTRTATDGTLLQVDHYRRDGTLLLSDRRDVRQSGVRGGRSVVLCDGAGVPVRSWGRIGHLYSAWLDALTQRTPSWMIVDSKTVARLMLGYRRRHVATVHVVHNSHLAAGGELRESRRSVFENLAAFDSVVVLTRRQRREVRTLTAEGRLAVIPNPVAPIGAKPVPDRERPRDRGIVLASLTGRKRVDHAMRAAAAAGARLDVFGTGELSGALGELAAATPGVVLHGHRPDARAELASASFLLATGRSEGFPLALLEAMAAGCIPVAYDVRYGPGELIDGRNGLLVPSGDATALAAAVEKLLAESPRRLARRRRRAMGTAARYTDAAVVARWSRELRMVALRRRLVAPQHRDRLRHAPLPGLIGLGLVDGARVLLAMAVRQLLPGGGGDGVGGQLGGESRRDLHHAWRVIPLDGHLDHLPADDARRGAML